MEYEDSVRIATPEGVELELPLAGIGSRLAARLIDALIIGAGIAVALLIYFAAVADASIAGVVAAITGILLGFLMLWGYDTLFEAWGSGRTPGKRAAGLRVVDEGGGPEDFRSAAIRNVLRPVDEYLTLWLAALISIVRSRRNQRLGDIAAGTLVVKVSGAAPAGEAAVSFELIDRIPAAAEAWDTTALTDEELAAARRFLERRGQLAPGSRAELALELAGRLRPKVHGADHSGSAEDFLELLVAVKVRRGGER